MQKWVDSLKIRKRDGIYFVGQYFLVLILLLLLLVAMIVFSPDPETETGPDILKYFKRVKVPIDNYLSQETRLNTIT